MNQNLFIELFYHHCLHCLTFAILTLNYHLIIIFRKLFTLANGPFSLRWNIAFRFIYFERNFVVFYLSFFFSLLIYLFSFRFVTFWVFTTQANRTIDVPFFLWWFFTTPRRSTSTHECSFIINTECNCVAVKPHNSLLLLATIYISLLFDCLFSFCFGFVCFKCVYHLICCGHFNIYTVSMHMSVYDRWHDDKWHFDFQIHTWNWRQLTFGVYQAPS